MSLSRLASVAAFILKDGKIGLGISNPKKIDLIAGSNSILNKSICSHILNKIGEGESPCSVPVSILKDLE